MSYTSINVINLHGSQQGSPVLRRHIGFLPVLGAIVTLALLFIAFLALTDTASAYTLEKRDEPVTELLTVVPTKVQLEMLPGQSTFTEIAVVNRSGITLDLDISVQDFEGSLDPDDTHVLLEDESSPWGARFWLDPELDEITLEHGETLTFDVQISIPLDAESGGHFAVVMVESKETGTGDEEGGVRPKSRLGSFVLIKIPGDIDTRAILNDPEVPFIKDLGPASIGLVFNNLGNIHQSPSGTVSVTNLLGQQVAEIPVQEWLVLPDSARRTTVEWPGRWHLGRYKVRAQISYGGDEGEVLYATSTMWFIPWKIILAALAASFIILFLITLIARRRNRKRQEVQEELEELRALKEAGISESVDPEAEEEWFEEDEQLEEDEDEYLEEEGSQETGEAGVTAPFISNDMVALNVLLPSTEDTNIVDISDPETRQLIRELINNELDLARMFIVEGNSEGARQELFEARSAALRLQLLAEVAMIDDLLNYL